MQQFYNFSFGSDISVFYVTLTQLQTERKCSIMQALVRKHRFSYVCEASQVKFGSKSSRKQKTDLPDLINVS